MFILSITGAHNRIWIWRNSEESALLACHFQIVMYSVWEQCVDDCFVVDAWILFNELKKMFQKMPQILNSSFPNFWVAKFVEAGHNQNFFLSSIFIIYDEEFLALPGGLLGLKYRCERWSVRIINKVCSSLCSRLTLFFFPLVEKLLNLPKNLKST